MATETLYENRPGGTIVRLADGTHEQVLYGTPYTGKFAPDNLAPVTVEGLRAHADPTPRISSEETQIALARDAHERSALDSNGQVNSSQSPVPSNYHDLSEDAAAILVMNLARYPEQQASVIMHEILYGGNRGKVIDAAGEYAHVAALSRIAALTDSQEPGSADPVAPGPSPVNPGDPGIQPGQRSRDVQAETRAAAALGAEQIKAGLRPRSAPKQQARQVEPSDGVAKAAEERLAERERLLDDREAQLSALAAQIQRQRDTPAGPSQVGSGTVEDTGGTGVPTDRHPAPDALEAHGFDGKGGPNTEGYFTNAQLDDYADRHDVEGVRGASNRKEKLAALTAAGHENPETPPQG